MEAPAFQERLLGELAASVGLLNIYIGHRLDLWKAMKQAQAAKGAGVTVKELVAATKLNERYLLELLQACAAQGYIMYSAKDDSFFLPPGHAKALTEELDPSYVAAFTCFVPSVASPAVMKPLLEAFKTGGGVPYEAYGEDCLEMIGGGNRPMFHNELATTWFPKIPQIHKALENCGHVLDVGCGVAHSSIAIAKGYPKAHVHALDIDAESIRKAKQNVEQHGLEKRITLHCCSGDEAKLDDGSCAVVTLFECLHDMTDPVSVLKSVKRFVSKEGVVLVADEKVEEHLVDMLPESKDGSVTSFSQNPKNFLGRFNLSVSVLHCLPQGLVDGKGVGTGAAIRPSQVRKYAEAAGFTKVEAVHESDFWRFYQLTI